jgi:hypothetical protein
MSGRTTWVTCAEALATTTVARDQTLVSLPRGSVAATTSMAWQRKVGKWADEPAAAGRGRGARAYARTPDQRVYQAMQRAVASSASPPATSRIPCLARDSCISGLPRARPDSGEILVRGAAWRSWLSVEDRMLQPGQVKFSGGRAGRRIIALPIPSPGPGSLGGRACPLVRPGRKRLQRHTELITEGGQLVLLAASGDDARFAEFAEPVVEDAWRHLVAALPQLAGTHRAVAQLPEHAQRPASAQEIQRGHDGASRRRSPDGHARAWRRPLTFRIP